MSVLVPPEMFGASGCQGESSHSGLFLLACLSLLFDPPAPPSPGADFPQRLQAKATFRKQEMAALASPIVM